MIVETENRLGEKLRNLYPEKGIEASILRYNNLTKKFAELFDESEIRFFSAPGRTELSGNHTDHNKGKVLAAGVHLDTIAAVSENGKNEVVIYSDECGEKPFIIGLNKLDAEKSEEGTLSSLVRGIAKYFSDKGYSLGGFNAVIQSAIPFGAGLSSSASVEVLIGEVFNRLFNKGKISKKEIALAGQYAENNYFGKPCGLMDQLACAYGGIIKIDFKDDARIDKIDFDLEKFGYSLLVVKTGKNHSDLTDDYTSITEEMKEVASFFGKEYLREVAPDKFYSSIAELREKISERAILRAFHFFEENERVEKQVEALLKNDIQSFLELVTESGNSSSKFL